MRGSEWNGVLGSGPGELGLIVRDRLGDAVCLAMGDEREQIAASLAAAVAALVDEDAELLGQWGLLMEWINNSRGTPSALGGSSMSHQQPYNMCWR